MKSTITICLGLLLAATQSLGAQTPTLQFPETLEAGATISVTTSGSGEGVLYIVGPEQVVQRKVTLGETIVLGTDDLHNAGRYTAFLVGTSFTETADFDVLPARQPATMSFLAKPSRLPVGLPAGISGVVYLFDAFRNLIVEPLPILFQLSEAGSIPQERTVPSHDGVAWLKMDSAQKAGNTEFQATVAGITEKRVVEQVPGDPCNLKMTARPSGNEIALETELLRDCRGNPVPDGTVVTFSEQYNGSESTVDAPLKRGVARTQLPAHDGAVISVATGVVLGNQIRWHSSGGEGRR
jgi:hypothetical protein